MPGYIWISAQQQILVFSIRMFHVLPAASGDLVCLTSLLGLVSLWHLVELLLQWTEGFGVSPALPPEYISMLHIRHLLSQTIANRLKVQPANCGWCTNIQKEASLHSHSQKVLFFFPGSTVGNEAQLTVDLEACGPSQPCPWHAVWP